MQAAKINERIKYLVVRGKIEKITLKTGLWRAEDGTIFALAEEKNMMDIVDRCGVGQLWSLSEESPLTAACKPHDYMYSSSAYQTFHTRKEADRWLRDAIVTISGQKWYRVFAKPFYYITRFFGGKYWENEKTR